jgi:hypothetical protein
LHPGKVHVLMEEVGPPKTSVYFHQTTRLHVPEDGIHHREKTKIIFQPTLKVKVQFILEQTANAQSGSINIAVLIP